MIRSNDFIRCLLLLCLSVIYQSIEEQFPTTVQDVVFVLLSQKNSYHTNVAVNKKKQFDSYLKNEQNETHYLMLHLTWPDVMGSWTMFPIISKITRDKTLKKKRWLFVFEEYTSFDVVSLLNLLQEYDPFKDHFLGHALQDKEPTIIHHFAFAENKQNFSYPDTAAGFILSMALAKKIANRLDIEKEPHDFSIDAKYELAQFIWDKGKGIQLHNVPEMCLKKSEGCCSWVEEVPVCNSFDVTPKDMYFAVKTYNKFHSQRVPVVKKTWAKDTQWLSFYSDVTDSSVPTINTGIPNTDRGHCAKTLAILKHILSQDVSGFIKWVILADDDTLLSVKRLTRVLSCYNASQDVALGERYGYGVVNGNGYDYITGGGGMVFSLPLVKRIISSEDCHCPSLSSPDDMTIGIFLKKLGVPVTHSPKFHQARPVDYSSEFLSYWDHVSFHKHWMIDPLNVYEEWLSDGLNGNTHSEL